MCVSKSYHWNHIIKFLRVLYPNIDFLKKFRDPNINVIPESENPVLPT